MENEPNDFWDEYAKAYTQQLKAIEQLSDFSNNSKISGRPTEELIKHLAKEMLPQFKISTGTIIGVKNYRDKRTVQFDLIICKITVKTIYA